MNKTLTIFFEEDYLIAAIKPFDGKYIVINQGNDIKYPLYFFVDNVNNKIDYSFIYKADYEDSKPNYYGNFLNLITDKSIKYTWYEYQTHILDLLIYIFNDIRNQYFDNLRKLAGNETINESESIPLNLIFSDNVKTASKETLKDYLSKQNFTIEEENRTLAELTVLHYINKNNFQIQNKSFAILEALGTNFNISIVNVQDNKTERKHFKVFPEYGADPRVHVIAKKIVDDINRQEGLLSSSEDLKKEYKRHQTKAIKIVEALKNFKKPFLTLSTTFAVEPTRKLVTNLSLEEIDSLSFLHARQFSSFLTDHFLNSTGLKILELDKIFLIGNTFNNDMVKKEFSRFGAERLVYMSDDISTVLQETFNKYVEKENIVDDNATMFMQTGENKLIEGINTYKEIAILNISDLKEGQTVKLNNFDPAPGKGAATQILQYLGSNQFVVKDSTRTLKSGDIAIAITTTIYKGIQVDLDITRDGKKVGIFRTRPVVTIEIK
jgi:hypothetical protein